MIRFIFICLQGTNDMNVEAASFINGNAMYNGLGNLDNCVELDQRTVDLSVIQGTDYSHNSIFLQDVPYLELNDLEFPVSHSAETIEMASVMMGDFCVPRSSDVDMRQFCFGSNSSARSQQVAGQNQLHVLPEHHIQQVNLSDLVGQVSSMLIFSFFCCILIGFVNVQVNSDAANVNQGYNAAYATVFSSHKQPEDSRYTAQNQERGRSYYF